MFSLLKTRPRKRAERGRGSAPRALRPPGRNRGVTPWERADRAAFEERGEGPG